MRPCAWHPILVAMPRVPASDGHVVDALRLHDVHKVFSGRPAVDGLTFSIPTGSIFGLLGPNGSGKTTTLRMITRIILPDRGRIEVLGADRGEARSAQVGYLPEERGLYRKATVRRMLQYLACLKGQTRREADEQIDHWLARFELASRADSAIESLSKGMAQRIGFIAAVLGRPPLLVLDEPFSGLDPLSSEVLRAAVQDLRRDGTTLLLSTHDMEYAERLCDRVVLMRSGQVVASGTVGELLATAGPSRMSIELSAPLDPSRPDTRQLLTRVGADVVTPARLSIPVTGDPTDQLRDLLALGKIARFEIVKPSLREVFLRMAGPAAEAPATPSLAEAEANPPGDTSHPRAMDAV